MRNARLFALTLAALAAAGPVFGRVLLSPDEAIRLAFPAATRFEERQHVLTAKELEHASRLAGSRVETELWTEHLAWRGDVWLGTAYFDTHLVRTLPETLLVVVTPHGTISRVEVLSFSEPPDYLPKPAWFAQFQGRGLDDELAPRRGIRIATGATLTVRAATLAARRVLAIHQVLPHPEAPREATTP